MSKEHMHSWASKSYSNTDGRAASSCVDEGERFWSRATNVGNYVSETHNPGRNGAPGPDAQTKSGSGDPGRRKYARPVG